MFGGEEAFLYSAFEEEDGVFEVIFLRSDDGEEVVDVGVILFDDGEVVSDFFCLFPLLGLDEGGDLGV